MEKENIKFDLLAGLVIIKCLLDNEECLFILDTGAKITSLNSKYKNDYEENKIESNVGAMMWVSNTKEEIISSLIIGNQKFENINTLIFDLSHVEKILALQTGREIKIHGVIGFDILKKWDFMIDYQKNEIIFNYKIDEKEFYINKFKLSDHLIIIEANINEQKRNLILDTGANGNMFDENLFEELTNFNYLTNPQKQNYKVGNIDVNILSGIIKNIKIFNRIEYVNLPCKFQNLDTFNKNPLIKIDGLVGYHILCNKKIILDYPNQRICFSK